MMVATVTFSQNLVHNPSFEDFSSCPASWGQINRCNGWYSNTTGTPDYFNSCHDTLPSSPHNVGMPDNGFGHQASAGRAYAGLITVSSTSPDYREYLGSRIPPLIPGAAYKVTLVVSLADICDHATDAPSIFFYKDMDTFLSLTNTNLPYTPQIAYSSAGHITNKLIWTTVIDSFIADSAYTQLAIGNFKNNASTTFTTMTGGGPTPSSYYYIDSISLERIPVFVSVDDTADRPHLTISPNPSNGAFCIALPGDTNTTIVITDVAGRVVKQLAASGIAQVTLDAPPGIYFVITITNSGVMRERIVVK